MQCDGYAPYKKLPADRITIAFCWSHLRREFFDVAERGNAPIAEAVARIAQIYAIEKDVRGTSADARRAARQARSRPLSDALKIFFELSSRGSQAGRIRPGSSAMASGTWMVSPASSTTAASSSTPTSSSVPCARKL